MARNGSTVEARVALALERIAQGRRAHLQSLSTAHGLSPLQIQLLDSLAAGPPPEPRTQDLARELDVRQPTLTEAINALAGKGLVERSSDPADKRRTTFALTDDGRGLAARLVAVASPIETAVVGLDPDARRDLLVTLLAVVDDLHGRGVLGVARTCTSCAHHRLKKDEHRCVKLGLKLRRRDLRVDCPVHDPDSPGRG